MSNNFLKLIFLIERYMEIIAPINRAKVGDVSILISFGAIGFMDIITNGIQIGELAKLKLNVFFVPILEIKTFKSSSEMAFVFCINFCEMLWKMWKKFEKKT